MACEPLPGFTPARHDIEDTRRQQTADQLGKA
jgi:hypothetical protein